MHMKQLPILILVCLLACCANEPAVSKAPAVPELSSAEKAVPEESTVVTISPLSAPELFAATVAAVHPDPFLPTADRQSKTEAFYASTIDVAISTGPHSEEALGVLPLPDEGIYAALFARSDRGGWDRIQVSNEFDHELGIHFTETQVDPRFVWFTNKGRELGVAVKNPSPELLERLKTGDFAMIVRIRPLPGNTMAEISTQVESWVAIDAEFEGAAITSRDFKTIYAHLGNMN